MGGVMMRKKKQEVSNRVGLAPEDKILNVVIYTVMSALMVIIIYPLIYILSSSFSSGDAVTSGKVLLWPVEFSTTGYKIIFSYSRVWQGYWNTIIYTVAGTTLNVLLTTMAAYPMARRDLYGKNVYMTFFMIIMFFSGGMIPNYILMVKTKLIETRWSVILSGGLSVTNMIIMRTFFQNSIPADLFDAARIDGVSDLGYLFKIILPLSKAIFSVITLYYGVGRWNTYFTSMMYIHDRDKYALQVVLRDILSASRIDLSAIQDAESLAAVIGASDLVKYALIVVATVPVLVVYPFVQKYFEKGVMIGSVKG